MTSDLALSMLNAAPHATFGLENRYIVFANHTVERVFGWKPKELIGQSTRVLYATQDVYEKVGDEVYSSLENERMVIKSEYPCKHKDGRIFFCRLSASKIDNGHLSKKLVVTFEDISELKKIEWRLLESENLYRTLAEGSFSGVYMVQDGKFKYLNDHVAHLGYQPDELVGRQALSIVHPEDRKIVRKFALEMLSGRSFTPYQYRALNKNGKIHWIMETVKRILYKGKPAVLGNSMDITELVDSRKKIEEFNKLRSSILDATPHSIMYLEDRKIIFVNNAVESVFGWKPEELIGKSIRMLYRSDKDYKEMGRIAYITLGQERVFDELGYPYRHKDGRDIICRVKGIRIGDNLRKRTLIATHENITEQIRTQDALRQRTKELEIKTKSLEETNIALNVILRRREEDKSTIEETVVNNIRELIIPCLQQMKKYRMDHTALKYASLAESYLTDIVSPFLRQLSAKHLHLTHREVLVASLLKDGKSSKEIADVLNITARGVDFHRNKIRAKLGIKNKKDNLRSYLLSFYCDEEL